MNIDFQVSEMLEEFIMQKEILRTAGMRFMARVLEGGSSGVRIHYKKVSTCKPDALAARRGCMEAGLVEKIGEYIPDVCSTKYRATDLAWQLEMSDPLYRHFAESLLHDRTYPTRSRVLLRMPYGGNVALKHFLGNGTGLRFNGAAVQQLYNETIDQPETFKSACDVLSIIRQFGRFPLDAEIVPESVNQSKTDHRVWQIRPCPQNIRREIRNRMCAPTSETAILAYPDLKSAEVNIVRIWTGLGISDDAYEGLFSQHTRNERKAITQFLFAGCNLNGINRKCFEKGMDFVTEDELTETLENLGGPNYRALLICLKRRGHRLQRSLKRTIVKIMLKAHWLSGDYTFPPNKTGIHLHDGFIIPVHPDLQKNGTIPVLEKLCRSCAKDVMGVEMPVKVTLL